MLFAVITLMKDVHSERCQDVGLYMCTCLGSRSLYLTCDVFPLLDSASDETIQTVSMVILQKLTTDPTYRIDVWPRLEEVFDEDNEKAWCYNGICQRENIYIASKPITYAPPSSSMPAHQVTYVPYAKDVTRPDLENGQYLGVTTNAPTDGLSINTNSAETHSVDIYDIITGNTSPHPLEECINEVNINKHSPTNFNIAICISGGIIVWLLILIIVIACVKKRTYIYEPPAMEMVDI